jgi:hypothetical protein
MSKFKESRATGRLHGAEFEPERAALSARRRERQQRRVDRKHAKGTGTVEAHGIKFEGELTAVPHHDVINHERDQEIADIEYMFEAPLNATREEHDRSEQAREHAERDIDEDLRPKQAEAQTKLEKVKDRVGVGRLALLAAAVICFMANLGVDYGAVAILPAPPLFQWLIVIGLGLATVWVAHLAAVQMARLAELHEGQDDQPALYRQHKVGLIVTTVLPVLAMIAFTGLRAANYSTEARLAGVPINVTALALGLLMLGILTYAIAVYTGFRFEWLRPKRDAESELLAIEKQIADKQRIADAAEIRVQEAVNQQEHLEHRRDKTIEAAEAHAWKRHARFDQDRRTEATRPDVQDAKAQRKAAARRGRTRPQQVLGRRRPARMDDLEAALGPDARTNGHNDN